MSYSEERRQLEQAEIVLPKKPIYQQIASLVQARINCQKSGNKHWFEAHGEALDKLVKMLPSGSGIDCGTDLVEEDCTIDLLVFHCSYHHMNENGYYDGWTEHKIKVKPSFDGITLKISGPDRNQIKEYLYDTYQYALTHEVKVV